MKDWQSLLLNYTALVDLRSVESAQIACRVWSHSRVEVTRLTRRDQRPLLLLHKDVLTRLSSGRLVNLKGSCSGCHWGVEHWQLLLDHVPSLC